MEHYLQLAIKAIFVENIILAFFIGMCSFIAISKKIENAIGLGAAVVFVMTITTPVDWIIYNFILRKGALTWTGIEFLSKLDLDFLSFISFIAVIAAMTQLVEMFIDRYVPALYNALGIFLPLIAVNCAILGASLFMKERDYSFGESLVFGTSLGIGWFLAIVVMAAIRKKLQYSNPPRGLNDLGLIFIVTGLMAIAFLGFSGIKL
jgi:Na+-transporting NADH:ubiquinone oxidoreductase subunit E